jgi:hypothetical protein
MDWLTGNKHARFSARRVSAIRRHAIVSHLPQLRPPSFSSETEPFDTRILFANEHYIEER